jgi:hypothetical protein
LYDIARSNAHDCAYWFAIETRAVAAAEIAQPPLSTLETQLGVASRDVRIIDDDAIVGIAPNLRFGLQSQRLSGTQRGIRTVDHEKSQSRRASLSLAHLESGDFELSHRGPEDKEEKKVDQSDEEQAQGCKEPPIGDKLINDRVDHAVEP